jgi:diguanylate cyclase (GGDEF)-like protein
VDNFGRVTEITRNIYRQGNVKSVLFTAVNDIGRHWNASRCVAGLCTPGKPPSAALEYCAPGVRQSDVMAIVKRIAALQALVVSHQGPVTIPNVPTAGELAAVKQYLADLEVQSILAVPLMDGDEHAGILILEQCEGREWAQADVFVLKTIADQMVLAVNNSKLRSLVKTLAVTDEKTGLLRRSSYLDVLLSEVRRAVQQKSTASVMLLQLAKPGLAKEVGEPAVENLIQQVGQVITGHIRQNDVAVRYDLGTIALVLSETSEKNSFFVVDKLRKALETVRMPGGGDKAVPLTAGIAEIVARQDFDPVDIVTEVINRAERALEVAKSEGGNKAHSLAPRLETEAVV